MNKLISIIIPTYNRAHFIGETLDSIIAQTYTNWECIIIDDGSTDNTKEIISKYVNKDNRFYYYHRPENKLKGPNSCRNYGFEKSKGFYIYWFDSDDLLLENSIETRIRKFNEQTDVVISKAEFFDSETGIVLSTNKVLSKNVVEEYFVGKTTYYVSGPVWKRSFLEKQKELFDENIKYLDDWDFNLRMIYESPITVIIDIPLFRYRSHPHSLSKQVNYLDINELISEYNARNKHLKILEKRNIDNHEIKKFVLKRYKAIFRDGLMQKNENTYYFFEQLVGLQYRFKQFKGILKTVLGFLIYKIFNRGYFLIK